MKVDLICPICGKEFQRYESQVKKQNFCSRECLAQARKDGTLKWDTSKQSARMTAYNREHNPTAMTFERRCSLRAARLGTGEGKAYTKLFGKHEHVVVAEQILGRKLLPGEIVHHIDRNKRNNNPSNLVVMTQSEHARLHAACRGQKEVMSNAFQALSVSAES